MLLKINLFEQITQHFYEDGNDIHWWIDEEDEKDFLESWGCPEENPDLKKTDTRIINGKQWNEFWIGGTYGEYEGTFSDQECPNCEHLMVNTDMEIEETGEDVKVQFCSNYDSDCGYVNEEYRRVLKLNASYEKKPYIPESKIRLAGETVFEFVERVGLSCDKKPDKFVVLNDNYWTECTICKETVPCTDFYIGSGTGFASVFFDHVCKDGKPSNGCPSTGTPFKKSTKEKWNGLLFGK